MIAVFSPQEKILHNHFTSKFSLHLVSMNPFRSILRFPVKFQADTTTADVQEIQQEVSGGHNITNNS